MSENILNLNEYRIDRLEKELASHCETSVPVRDAVARHDQQIPTIQKDIDKFDQAINTLHKRIDSFNAKLIGIAAAVIIFGLLNLFKHG